MFPNGGIFKKRARRHNPFCFWESPTAKKKTAILTPENRIIMPALRLTEMGTMQKSPIRIQKKIPEAHIVHLEAFRYLSLYCTGQKEDYAFASVQLRLSV